MTARLVLEIQTGDVAAALSRLARFGHGPLQLALNDIGQAWQISHELRFDQEQSPDGSPWAALSPRYKRRKDKRRPGVRKLVYDNFLKGQLRAQVDGEVLLFGTNRPYGALQHYGGTSKMAPGPAAVPARPWLGLSAADDVETLDLFANHLRRVAEGP